jgi:hypothetical protein
MFIIGRNPTFLSLQHQLKHTRKYRGTDKRRYYNDFKDNRDNEEYDFDSLVYKKALQAANQVVRYYYETGEVSPRDKIKTEIHVKR